MSRIIAGVAGGRTLTSVASDKTRPTTDRVKEALFSRLESLGAIDDAEVLDLYAGSGALGVEAVSRGARRVYLVEAARPAITACRKNASLVKESGEVVVVARKVSSFLNEPPSSLTWDLVFIDPPYDLPEAELGAVLETLAPLVEADGVVVVERSSRSPEPQWPAGLDPTDSRSYGETVLHFGEKS